MGIGAMTVAMLGLPLTSTLLVSLLIGADAVAAMPLVIVAVVVAYVTSAHLRPAPEEAPSEPSGEPAAPQAAVA